MMNNGWLARDMMNWLAGGNVGEGYGEWLSGEARR